jgi:hypothetical protein
MGRFRNWLTGELPDDLPPPAAPSPGAVGAAGGDGVSPRIAAAAADRERIVVTTRAQAMENSVVNRSRDLICGVMAGLPLNRIRTRGGVDEDLGPGWLTSPDPTHTRGWFVAQITDDLFFHEVAFARITARDPDGNLPVALEWMPFDQINPAIGRDALEWWRPEKPGVFWWPNLETELVIVDLADVVIWESPVSGLLRSGKLPLSIASRLDASAMRFAAMELAAGWLKQNGGEPLSQTEAEEKLRTFAANRAELGLAWLNEVMEYHESQLNPSQLQLVEGRAYQDAATARLCNVPNYAVGVGVPNDSMTYKTAVTARLDLIDFGIAAFLTCWEQTLSSDRVTPHGTRVAWDLEPFLRSAELAVMPAAQTAPAPIQQGAAA